MCQRGARDWDLGPVDQRISGANGREASNLQDALTKEPGPGGDGVSKQDTSFGTEARRAVAGRLKTLQQADVRRVT